MAEPIYPSAPAHTTATKNAPAAIAVKPRNQGLPVISGQAVVGSTLTSSAGTWANSPTSYQYNWRRCDTTGANCTKITGLQPSSNYTLVAADQGHTIDVNVQACNASGCAVKTSNPTAVVQPASQPSGSGLLVGDQAVEPTADSNGDGGAQAWSYTASASGTATGVWVYVGTGNSGLLSVGIYSDSDGSPGTLLARASVPNTQGAWNQATFTNGPNITNGTKYWLALLGTGGGSYVYRDNSTASCTTVGTSGGLSALPNSWSTNWTASGYCPASIYVTGGGGSGGVAPSNTSAPMISGTPQQGDTLTVSNGSWSGDTPIIYSYQWQDCNSSGASCANISGASSSSYQLQASDVGSTIRSVVTATNAGGSTSAGSAATAVVSSETPSPPSNTALPQISGTTTQGNTLSTTNGSWTGSPTGYAYQWQDCDSSGASCAKISGATSSSYALQGSDVGSTIRSVVTATNQGGSSVATSGQTEVVVPSSGSAPVNTSLPVIHGYTTPGSEVMANNPGSWTNSPASFTYQWQDCKSGSCSNATNTTGLSGDPCSPTAFCYVVSSAEASAGDTIQVTVTAHNSSGTGRATAQASQAASNSEPVNCALTQTAGRDGGSDSNDGSCWGQNTGVTGATGCTEAQLLAGSPAMCGSPYFSTVTSDQNFTSANQALVNKVVGGCVAVQSGANNFQTRDVLIHTTDWSCQNNSSDSSPGAWGDGNDQNVPSGVVIRDTEVDDPHGTLEQSGDADDFGIVIGAGGLAQRVNTHGWSKDITVDGTSSAPMTVEDSFVHDPAAPQNNVADCQGGSSPGPHEDPFWGDSASYVTAEHDYVSAAGGGDCITAAVAFLSDWGAPTHDTIDNTFMEGGSAPGNGRPDAYFGKSGTCAVNTTVTHNAFSSDTGSLPQIEEWSPSNTGNAWSGNVTPETGATVAAPNSCN